MGRLADHFDLATQVHQEGAVRVMNELDAVDGVERLHDVLRVIDVAAIDGHVAGHDALADRYDVDGAQVAAQLAHLRRHAGQHAGAVANFQPHGHAVTRAGGHVYGHTSSNSDVRKNESRALNRKPHGPQRRPRVNGKHRIGAISD